MLDRRPAPIIPGITAHPAERFTLPNIRRAFLPDPGHIIVDVDLSGADAQVVAWEANEPALKRAFIDEVDIHNYNGKRIWGEAYEPKKVRRKLTWRDECKRGVHGTNYVAGVRALQSALGWSMQEVDQFKKTWLRLNPNIGEWHKRTDAEVRLRRTVRNAFGYRIVYFDRPDGLLPEALAWIPQSTIACVTARAALRMKRMCPWAPLLLQVHDSLVFQLPFHLDSPLSWRSIKHALEVEIPFPGDPRIIPWGIKISTKSWGDLKETTWSAKL
jgi:DNA polymerase I